MLGAIGIMFFISCMISVYAIYEDQSFICKENFWLNDQHKKMISCIMVNDDVFLNQTQKDQIDTQFFNELDTFDSIYLSQAD